MIDGSLILDIVSYTVKEKGQTEIKIEGYLETIDELPDDSNLSPILSENDKQIISLQKEFDSKLSDLNDVVKVDIEAIGTVTGQNFKDMKKIRMELVNTNMRIINRRIRKYKTELEDSKEKKSDIDKQIRRLKEGKERSDLQEQSNFLFNRIKSLEEKIKSGEEELKKYEEELKKYEEELKQYEKDEMGDYYAELEALDDDEIDG